MSKFTAEELKVFLDHGIRFTQVAMILEQTADDEPELMKYWVYRKLIRKAPIPVITLAVDRFNSLLMDTGLISKPVSNYVMEDVCVALWQKLTDEERQALMRSID